MASVNDILLQAVGQNDMLPEANADAAWVPPVIPTTPIENKVDALVSAAPSKQANVAAASAAKQHSMTPADYFRNAVGADTGKGRESATQQELDLRDMNPAQLRAKYGKDARDMIIGQAGGYTDLSEANTRGQRSPLELWGDFSVTFGQGLGGALGGMGALATGVGALATGMPSEAGGTAAAEMLGDFNKFMDENKTLRLQAREKVKEAKNNLDESDNAQQMLKDVETDGELLAGLKRVGRDTIDALSNATDDPATFGAGLTNALGSFVATGPVGKVLNIASKGVLGTTSAIAATEAGGSYAGAIQSVMGRSHKQLMAESPNYRGLIEAGVDPEEAKRTVANRAGLVSAALTAPVAAAAGRLVHRFEGNPLALGSGRALAGNVARETAEETIQSGAGQFAQNVGDRLTANEDADLTEGVGRQLAEGGLYGMGMTTALGIPSIAKSGVVGAGRMVASAINDRIAGIEEASNKASPVSEDTVAKAAAEQQASAPQAEAVLRSTVEASDAAPEVKAAANTYVDNLMTASNYDAVEAPPSLAADFQDVTTRHDAIKRAAELIMGAEEGSPTQLRAGYYLHSLVQDYADVINGDQDALAAMPADSQGAKIIQQYQDLMGAITSTPTVMKAVETVMAQIQAAEAKSAVVTPETLATPEGQQDVQDVLSTAEMAPEKVDLATGEAILKQVEQGNVTVTPRQKAALDTSVALLRAVQEADKAAVANGSATKVGLNISSVDGEKGKSLTQHAKGIMSAWKAGDRDLAADRLVDLKNFAKGMSNKVGALNAHFAAGKPNDTGLNYEVFVGGEPVTSKAKVATRTNSEGGVKFAQQVAAEAKLLADVYNGLVTAFPDLQAEHLAVTPLAGELTGPAADVVARIKSAKAAAPVVKADVTPTPVKVVTPTVDTGRIAKLDDEMTRREDTAVAQNQQEELEEEQAQQKPVTPKQIFTGRIKTDGKKGASIGSLADGTRRQLMVDPDGGYFWGDYKEASDIRNGGDLGSLVIEGEHAGFKPATFDRDAEAIAAAESTPQSKTQPTPQAAPAPENATIESYVNHSGGAKGADTAWDSIGRRFGVTKHRHYQKDKTPLGNTSITPEQFQEGLIKAKKAAMMLGRNWSNKPYIQGLLSRNWQQVKNADAVFAIAEKLEGDFVSGGTGYAVAMARAEGKPVFVFDQSQGAWFKATKKGWEQSPTPTLTPNFAGIGTRELTAEGRQAIEDVYAKTKASLANSATMGDVAEAQVTEESSSVTPSDTPVAPKVEANTPESVKAQLTKAKQLPFLERITAVNALLNKENINDIVEGSAELDKMANDLLGDTQGFTDAFNKLRVRVSRFISDELRSRMMDRFDDLMAVPVAHQDSVHTEEQIKFLTWLTKLADAQDKRQGDLFNMPEPTVAEKAPAQEPVVEEAPVVKEPAPAKTEPVEEAVAPEPAVKPVVETPALKDMVALFYKLRGGMNNLFNRSFKLPKKQRTRTIGTENPVAVVRDALKDSAAFTALLGSSPKGNYTPEIAKAYKGYLQSVEDFVSALDDNLQEFLDENNLRDRAAKGEPVETFLVGKTLNIAEEVDGTLVYNPELAQGAVLAGLQWFLESPQIGTTQDAQDIAKLLGMTEDTVTNGIVISLTEGMSVTEAKRSMAQKIRNYWGVANESTGQIGYQEGIPEAMAAEMLRLFVKGGWLTETKVKLTEAEGLPALDSGKPNVKEFIRLIPAKIDPDSPIHDFPSAIEQAVLVEPEEINYVGEGNLPKVAQDQLRNPGVKNTAQQLEAIENEQKTPYFVNTVMAGFYIALGRDNIVKLFGAGDLDPKVTNVNHAQSMEGVNRSTVAAFDHLQMLLGQVANNGPLDQTPIHYAFNMTRVGRLQMLGKHNPQANKLVREAILPTYSTLDLSSETSPDYKRFMLGVAQLLGVKVHKELQATGRAKAEAMLSGPLAPVVAELSTWANNHKVEDVLAPGVLNDSITDMLIEGFKQAGEALTPMALHAVMEYARMKGAADKSAFRTAIYVEADGVTNGPINAMVLFTTGMFKGQWIRNVAKGGLFFNRPGETVNSHNQTDKQDLYQATTNVLDQNLNYLRKVLEGDELGTRQMNSMLHLMTEFYGGDLKYTENENGGGTLELKRGIAKNPLTITIYGAGAGGIAANMTKLLTDAIYERMSQVAQAQASGEKSLAIAMFGPQSSSTADAEARFGRFVDAYYNLTNTQAGVKKDGSLFFKSAPSKSKPTSLDPVKFTFEADQIQNMQSNVKHLFVSPMRDAISETVGQELLDTAELLRQATQAQSIVLEHAFKAEVEAALNEKAKDPNWKKSDFLTRGELAAINKKLEHLSPLVRTEGQSFYIAGSESADVGATEFGRALSDQYRTPAFVAGPKDAGVSGIPFMNIGTGDGLMMQLISIMKNAITGTLKIFDGMNMPLDQMEQGAEQANEAVFQTWKGNPLAAVHSSFDKFMSDADLGNLSGDAKLALTKALFGLGEKAAKPDGEIMEAMLEVNSRLLDAQQQIEARHRVMDRVAVSIDQMAAVGIPFQKNGDLPLAGTDPDAIAEQLNVYYNAELAAIRADQPTNKVGSAIESLATVHESGAKVMSAADLKNLPAKLTADQAAVMTEVINSLAARDYTIVYGTPAEVAAYRGGEMESGVQGFTDVAGKHIYLLNPSTETLLHELIHAATFEAIIAYYSGTSTKQVADAVGRIETLMKEFLATGQELTQTSESVNSAFNTVASVINQYQANGQQAKALNEFMAWTLTNPSLVRIAQRAEVSRLAKARNAVVSFIKSLFNIKAEVGKDIFSNLLFNSAVIMQSQPALAERFASGMLFQNSVYGDNDRLSAVNEALNKAVGIYLETPVKAGEIDKTSALFTGVQNSYHVAEAFMGHGFNMNMQEASTFHSIVTALSTEAAIDPNAMAGVQQLYAHVMKGLSIESFMADPVANDPNDRAQAAEKFDVLSGKYLVTRDLSGRSSLLPAFLALATVNDTFRNVLAEMDLPKSAPNKAGTLDALLENTGNMLMDKLGQRMQGTKKATNVQQAIDLLNARMAEVINQRETYIDTMAAKAGGALDVTNDKVVEGMSWLAKQAMKVAARTQRNAAGRVERAIGGVAAGFAALIDENSATAVAQATMATINKTKMWDSVHTLINDLVGRTENNASIYDMIKAVRSVVNRTRQQYRENLPETLASKFTRELTKNEKASLHRSMAKTDLAALGKDALTIDRAAAITALEADLSSVQHWNRIQAKAKQLATFMNTGVAGKNLLRNPEAIARLMGEGLQVGALADTAKLDRLITLYALEGLSQEDKDTLSTLAQDQKEGMEFTLAYLTGQRAEEQSKATGRAKFNYYKGYVPSIGNEGVSMLVAHDFDYAKLIGKSYQRVGDYEGSSLDRGMSRGYYFIPVSARATFEQGIMQNVHQTAGGVDQATGFSLAQTAGRITYAADVKKLTRSLSRETGPQHLLPVYSETGAIVAFERPLDPVQMERTMGEQDLHKAIGQWRGRQVEEGFSQVFNDSLITKLHDMYERDLRENPDNAKQYVDVLSASDPVLRDAAKLMSHQTRATVKGLFGKTLMVRRDMLNDVLGYRSASIGDAWTGNSRWSPATQEAVRNLATAAFGNNAYKTLLTAEKKIQNIVSDAKVLIVVKSVIVPVANFMSNMYQLVARGVPVRFMAKAMPSKLAEVESYTKGQVRLIEAEAELRAATGNPRVERKLKTEIQALKDSHKRMSIWPLIEAGEFSGIADASLTRNEVDLTSGRLQVYMEQAAQKLPGWSGTVGRYALVTKDTALFQGLQKAVEYGDFLAKAVLFDDLVGRKGMTKADALARVTEEFVNYDRLPGRFRGSMENLGLLWFYNFKIRSVKVAASMIRNNPVHAMLASWAPSPDVFGTVGLSTEDNMITKLFDGTLDNSMGPGQGMHAVMLNPWINLTQ